MQILDQYGNPLDRGVLREPQTAALGWLQQAFATHPSRGLTPAKLARILEDAEQGMLTAQADLFLDMEEKDAHIFAEMSKRKRAILTLDWDVAPPRDASAAEEADADWLREVLQDMENLDDVLLDALDGIGHGFAALEIEWQILGREWVPREIHHRPQGWFQTDIATRSQIRLRDNTAQGADLQPFGWIFHAHRAKSGYISRGGLHRILSWPYLFKNYSVRDLAEFLEIYGLPLRLGKYPPGASDQEKVTLLRAVTGIGHNAAGIIPEGMSIEFEKAAEGTQAPFEAMIRWCEMSQSKAILGGTLTSQSDGKSSTNALGNVHNEVRHDLLVSDAKQLGGTLTKHLLYPLIALNRGVRDQKRLPRFVFDTQEPEDIALYADALPKLTGIGMKIKARWAHEKLRIPEAEGDDEVLGAPAVPPSPASGGGAGGEGYTAANRAALKSDPLGARHASPDAFDVFAEDLAAEWEQVTDPLVAPIEQLAAECKTLEEFQARLPEALEKMDAAKLTAALARGQFAAAVWGRIGGDNRGEG